MRERPTPHHEESQQVSDYLKPEDLSSLYQAIAHGDNAHRAWLREALNNWNEHKPLPIYEPQVRDPVPMLLRCVSCGLRHVDKGVFATKPHHTHACQNCGEVWRPAVVPTVGVQFLPGFKDEKE